MTTRNRARSTVRVAEATYAFVCALLWLGLPLPPGRYWVTSVYLGGTALVAATLAWQLRRPTRGVWGSAVALSTLVIALQLARLPELIDFARGELTAPIIVDATDGITVLEGPKVTALILVLGMLPLVLQSIVAVCCYQLRQLAARKPSS